MSKSETINSLAWIIIDSASKGYVSSNDLDFANDCLDKVQGQSNTGLQSDNASCSHINKIFFPSGRACCAECGLPIRIAAKA
jgi:hypothetical protein